MENENPYVAENRASYEMMRALVRRLGDEELEQSLEAGWNVASVLAHVAYWDQRAAVLIEKWEKEGVGPSENDIDVVNEAMRVFLLAIPPRAAAEMAVAYAEKIDQIIARLSPEMLATIARDGQTVRLNRGSHRRMHCEQIEKALGVRVR